MFALRVGNERYEIHDDLTFIGRDPTCQVIISDDSEVSRKHACLIDLGTRVILMDFKSSNGTLLNSVPIQQQELKPGDQIQIGGTVFTVDVPEPQRAMRHITSEGYKQHFFTEDLSLALRHAYEFLTSKAGQLAVEFYGGLISRLRTVTEQAPVCDQILEAGMTLAGADRGFVMLLGEGNQGLSMVSRRGLDADYFLRRDLHWVLINEALENQRVVIPKANYVEKVFHQNTLVMPNVCSSVVVPLIFLSNPIGVLYADRRLASGPFHENDLKSIVFSAYEASVFLGNLRLTQPLKHQDELLRVLDISLTGGEFIYCEVCGAPIDPASGTPIVSCLKCETLHHRDCWEYNNRCAIYGCMHSRMKALGD